MDISINIVKKASDMLDENATAKLIEEKTGLKRAGVKDLVSLYGLMKNVTPESSSQDYIYIRKQKYINLSIKIQHKLNDMRIEFKRHKKILMREKGKMIKAKYSLGDVKAIIEELEQKQQMLNVTSSNLQHAEDGYEYIKLEWKWNRHIYFMYGIAFLMGCIFVMSEFFAKITIVFN